MFWIVLLLITSFFLGASIGSFLGVIIDRVPRKESIILKASHCTNCNTPIKWYQNIPVLSFLLLKGRCAKCKTKIPAKFFLLEVIGGVIGVAIISIQIF